MEPTRLIENRIQLAISTYHSGSLQSLRAIAHLYNIPRATLTHRLSGRQNRTNVHMRQRKLTEAEESVLIEWIEHLISLGFPPRHDMLRDIVNNLLKARLTRDASYDQTITYQPIGKNWITRYLANTPRFKSVFSRQLDRSRALNNNRTIINEWFDLYKSVVDKYGIQPEDIWNMDEKGFMAGISTSSKVIVRSKKTSRFVTQAGNREWITVVECCNPTGKALNPMIIFKGKVHLEKWHDRTILRKALLGISPTGWSDNELGLEWLQKIFVVETERCRKGRYRLLILDGHASHISYGFIQFCKDKDIIPLCLPAHSTHLLQPLDVGIFSPLAHYYGRGVDDAVRGGRTNIDKSQFFTIYNSARQNTMTTANIISSYRTTGLVPFEPTEVLKRLPPEVVSQASIQDDDINRLQQEDQLRNPKTPRTTRELDEHIAWVQVNVLAAQSGLAVSTPSRVRIQQIGKVAQLATVRTTILEDKTERLALTISSQNLQKRKNKRVKSTARVLFPKDLEGPTIEVREDEIEAPVAKRKRGRPRKVMVREPSIDQEEEEEELCIIVA